MQLLPLSLEHQPLLSSPIWLPPLCSDFCHFSCPCCPLHLFSWHFNPSPLGPHHLTHLVLSLPSVPPLQVAVYQSPSLIKASHLKGQERLSLTLNNWGTKGTNTPSCGKSACNFTVSSLYLQFCIWGLNQPQMVSYYGTQLLKTIWVWVNLHSSNLCCINVNCNLYCMPDSLADRLLKGGTWFFHLQACVIWLTINKWDKWMNGRMNDIPILSIW